MALFDGSFPITGWQIDENISGDSALTIGKIQADELHVKMFWANTETVRVPDYPLYLSFAKVIAFTDTSITVRAFDSNPVFADGGAVKVERKYLENEDFIFEQMWIQVRNYQPQTDGTQTWDIVERNGEITNAEHAIAYYYGETGNGPSAV